MWLPQAEDPPFLTVGTEVSAKCKGAFCEAKVNKVVKVVKIKVTFKLGLGTAIVSDENVKGVVKVGSQVKALHPDKNSFIDAIINKIQDCSQYTVVFDDGDITTLRRTSLCLKSGRHFAQSETLDQLPLTHPEHFGTPVVGGRKGRRSHQRPDSDESTDEEENDVHKRHRSRREEWEKDIGKVVCVEMGDKKRQKDNWFPGLVVAPTAQDTVKIETKKDYIVRSFQDGRYYTVPKKEASPFRREIGMKVTHGVLKIAVEKALQFITNDELPPHWDRDLLFGTNISDDDSDQNGSDTESSGDEPVEEKDHFVAQLYKYMEECGTPINKGPTVGNKDLDLYKLFMMVQKLGGFNRVMNQNQWKVVSTKMGLQNLGNQAPNLIKAAYKRYLQSFEDFYRKLGCTMVSNPRGSRTRHRSGRSLIRDCDRTPRASKKKDSVESSDSTEEEDKKDDDEKSLSKLVMKEEKKIKEEPKVVRSLRHDMSQSPLPVPESMIKEEKGTRESLTSKEKTRDISKESTTREKSRELIREKSRESLREKSREPIREKSREPIREKSREPIREKSRELLRETSRESIRETSREPIRETSREPIRETSREPIRETSREPVRETSREPVRETSREPVRETSREPVREKSREPIREKSREPIREKSREPIREKSREPIREIIKREKLQEEPVVEKIEEISKDKCKEQIITEKSRDVMTTREKLREPLKTKEPDRIREPRTPRSESKLGKAAEGKTRSSVKKEESETEDYDDDDDDDDDVVEEEEEEYDDAEKEVDKGKSTPSKSTGPSQTTTRSTRYREESHEKEDLNKKTNSTPTRGSKSKGLTTPCNDSIKKSIRGSNTILKTDSSVSCKSSSSPPGENQDESGSKKGSAGRGRWRKKAEGDLDPPVGKSLIPHHVPVMVGDKLKVLYGPNAKESKVTYEAKVLEVEEEGNAPMYYVHYLGWNTRYDEWIRRPRIAANLTWDISRAKKGRAATTKEIKEKKEKEKEKREDKLATSSITSSPKDLMVAGKRGRQSTVVRERRVSERSDTSGTSIGGTSLTTTSSRSTPKERGNSNTSQQPDSPLSSVEPRKTRSTGSVQQDTTESESECYESDAETGSEPSSSNHQSGERQSNTNTSSSATSTLVTGLTTDPLPSLPHTSLTTDMMPTNKEKEISVKEEPNQNQNQQCGKDIDLNAIMSEMKGLDKPIKKEEDRTVSITKDPLSPRVVSSSLMPQTLPTPEKKTLLEAPTTKKMMENMTTPAKKMIESPVSPATPSPISAVSLAHTHEKIPLSACGLECPMKVESLEDDVYDFKEPEPFDIGEMRTRKIGRKSGVAGSAGEDSEPDSPRTAKKKGRPKKDCEGDISESDSDYGPSPRKRAAALSKELRENPAKRSPLHSATMESSKETAGSTLGPDTSSLISDKKDILSTLSGVSLAHTKLPVKNEPTIKTDPSADFETTNKTEIQIPPGHNLVKFETPGSPSRTVKTESPNSPSPKTIKSELSKPLSPKVVQSDVSNSPPPAKLAIIEFVKAPTPSLPQPELIKSSPKVPQLEIPKKIPTMKESMRGTTIPLKIKAVSTVDRRLVSSPKTLPIVSSYKQSVALSERSGLIPPSGSSVGAPVKQGDPIDSQIRTTTGSTSFKPAHLLAQAAPPVQSRAMALAKPKSTYDFKTEKHTQGLKAEEKVMEAKVIPFSQRQQHIFPHLLNRPTELPDKKEVSQKLNVLPVHSPPRESSQEGTTSSSQTDTKPQLMKKESLEEEMVIPKYNPSTTAIDQQEDIKAETPGKTIERKQRRSSGRAKKPLSREFVPDTSEESDTDVKISRTKIERIVKREDENYSPMKKIHRNTLELDKKTGKRNGDDEVKDEEEETDDSQTSLISKGCEILHSEDKASAVEEDDEDDNDEDEEPRVVRSKPRNSATARRMIEEAEEGGLGDLLCEETIPPGSPMPQDNIAQDSEESHATDLNNEMPFASVPTGSSFSKRGSGVAHQQGQQAQQQSQGSTQTTTVAAQGPQYNIQPQQIPQQQKLQVQLQHQKSHQPLLPSTACKSSSSSQVAASIPSTIAASSSSVSSSKSSSGGQISGEDNMSAMSVGIPADSQFGTDNSGLLESSAIGGPGVPIPGAVPEDPGGPPPTAIDNTPPTTPESIISNISDSPQRDNEPGKLDDTSKSGRDSSEVEQESMLEHSKMDYLFSEDSNTMDSTTHDSSSFDASCGRPSMRGMHGSNKRPSVVNMGTEGDGSETEEGISTYIKPRKRRRGPRSRASNDPDNNDDDGNNTRKSSGSGNFSSRRRRRHSSSRSGKILMFTSEDGEASALSTLSLAASAHSHQNRSRYNFCQKLDPDLDATKRIAVLQQRIQELKRTYMQVKTELASVERRRKKLRRKEREKEAKAEAS